MIHWSAKKMVMMASEVNPFVDAAVSTFNVMCRMPAQRNGKLVRRDSGAIENRGLMGIIGLSGTRRGAALMVMSVELAIHVVSNFMGEDVEKIEDLTDGFGELLNIISGSAAAELDRDHLNLALPTVIIGKENQIYASKTGPWVIIPMKFATGEEFEVKISLEERE